MSTITPAHLTDPPSGFKYRNIAQFIIGVERVEGITRGQRIALTVLANHADYRTGKSRPGNEALMRATGCTRQGVNFIMNQLVRDRRLVEMASMGDGGRGLATVWRIRIEDPRFPPPKPASTELRVSDAETRKLDTAKPASCADLNPQAGPPKPASNDLAYNQEANQKANQKEGERQETAPSRREVEASPAATLQQVVEHYKARCAKRYTATPAIADRDLQALARAIAEQPQASAGDWAAWMDNGFEIASGRKYPFETGVMTLGGFVGRYALLVTERPTEFSQAIKTEEEHRAELAATGLDDLAVERKLVASGISKKSWAQQKLEERERAGLVGDPLEIMLGRDSAHGWGPPPQSRSTIQTALACSP